jgi:hypothetical protein
MGGMYATGTGHRVVVPRPRQARRVSLWLFLIALVPFAAIYFSMGSRTELDPTLPSEFFEVRPEWNAERRDAEANLARAYWDCAMVNLQWKYPYGFSLPEKPPPDFQIDVRALSLAKKVAPQSRERYWQRLRKVWGLRQSWREIRVWKTDWLTKPFDFWRGLKNKKD